VARAANTVLESALAGENVAKAFSPGNLMETAGVMAARRMRGREIRNLARNFSENTKLFRLF